eukprot:Clim_evm64s207 gene=Clim_evmTU64s207
MPVPAIGFVAFDFDGTLTTQNTVGNLVKLSFETVEEKWPERMDDHKEHWRYCSTYYETNANITFGTKLEQHRPHCLDSMRKFLGLFEKIEGTALSELSQRGVLAGISKPELRRASSNAKDLVRPGVIELLRSLDNSGVDVHVISLNWSRDFIYHMLNELIPREKIHCNDLLFDEEGEESSGALQVKMAHADDKEKLFHSLVETSRPLQKGKGGASMFVGDSHTDLLPMITADVGILIGQNQQALKVCDRFGVQVKPVHDIGEDYENKENRNGPVIYQVYGDNDAYTKIRDHVFSSTLARRNSANM